MNEIRNYQSPESTATAISSFFTTLHSLSGLSTYATKSDNEESSQDSDTPLRCSRSGSTNELEGPHRYCSRIPVSFSFRRRGSLRSQRFKDELQRLHQFAKYVGAEVPSHILLGVDSPEAMALAKMVDDFSWLEVLDQKHRFGANLRVYYGAWERTEMTQNFFSWLDDESAVRPDLSELPREKLEQERVLYLNETSRASYKIFIRDGVFFWGETGEKVTTGVKNEYIFVRGVDGQLYLGRKVNRHFHHTSFLGGGPVLGAGRLVCTNGVLQQLFLHSGHYRLGEAHANVMAMLQFFKDCNVDLTQAKVDVQRLMRVSREPTGAQKLKKSDTVMFVKAERAFWFLRWKDLALNTFLPHIRRHLASSGTCTPSNPQTD